LEADAVKWRLFICSDCDSDDGVVIMQVADDAHPEAACKATDHCPGCGSYLSLLGMGDVEVSGNALIHLRMREPAEADE
jgi:formate dehydrogenase maturation protein FdhE